VSILALMKNESPTYSSGVLLKNFEYEKMMDIEFMSTNLDIYTMQKPVAVAPGLDESAYDGFIRATFIVRPLHSLPVL